MIQIWTSNEKGSDKLIAFGNNTIYKANPKSYDVTEELAKEMRTGKLDNLSLWWIQTYKCTEIRLQDGKSHIELLVGKEAVEELRIKDEYTRYQIFDYLKSNVPNSASCIDKWTPLRAGKKPFLRHGWCLYFHQPLVYSEFLVEAGAFNSSGWWRKTPTTECCFL